MQNGITITNPKVSCAIRAMVNLFSDGSATDIQQFLAVLMDEVAIHNAASPDNEQVWLQSTP